MRYVIPFRPRAAVVLLAVLLVGVTPILCAPITLELAGGNVIKGDLISWNGQQAVIKAEFGSLTFKREQLSQATLQRLDLLSGDPQKLVARSPSSNGREPSKGQRSIEGTSASSEAATRGRYTLPTNRTGSYRWRGAD